MTLTTDQQAAILEQISATSETRRATVPAMEGHLYNAYEVLDQTTSFRCKAVD